VKAISSGTANGVYFLFDHPVNFRGRQARATGPNPHLVDKVQDACVGLLTHVTVGHRAPCRAFHPSVVRESKKLVPATVLIER